VGISVPYPEVSGEASPAGLGDLEAFRAKFYDCLSTRADALFELTDAVLCSPGPVTTLVDLSLCPEHRRGHGALYDGLSCGAIEIKGLQFAIAALKLPRGTDGRITLGIDVSPWLRPDAPSSADRLFCHVHGRGKNQAQMIPGWPYSVVAAVEPGRTSWTAVLDAVRLNRTTTTPPSPPRRSVRSSGGSGRPGTSRMATWTSCWSFDSGYDVTWRSCSPTCRFSCWAGCARTGPAVPRPATGPDRAAGAARPGVHIRRPQQLAGTGGDHDQRHQPLRNRAHRNVGPVAPQVVPPRRVGRPRGATPDHRGNRDPADGGSPAR